MAELNTLSLAECRRVPSRTFSSIFFLLYSYLSVVLVIVQGILLVPLYLRQISVELYGAWLASGNVIAYLSLFDFGFATVLSQQVAQAYGASDRGRVARLGGTGALIGAGICILIGVVGIILGFFSPTFVGITGKDADTLRYCVMLSAFSTALTIFVYFVGGISLGLQRSFGVGFVNFVAWVLGISAILFGLQNGWGLYAIPLGYVTRAVLSLIGITTHLWFAWRREIGVVPRFDKGSLRSLGGLSSLAFLGKLGSTLISQSDALIIANLLGPQMTTVYALTGRAKDTLQTFPDRISSSVVPGLAHLSGENKPARVKQIALDVISISLGVTALCAAGILALNRPFVSLWVGENLFGGMALTLWICIYFVLMIMRSALNNLLFAIGEIKTPSVLTFAEAVVRIPLAIAFALNLGLIGIPIAASLALLLVNGFFLTRIFSRKFRVTWVDLRERWASWLLYPVMAICVGIFWGMLPLPTRWVSFIVSALLLGVLLGILLWTFNQQARDLFFQIIQRLGWLPKRQRI